MTGKLARLLVGTCMTAALTVTGFAGSVPAAHAGNNCFVKAVGVVVCNVPVNVQIGNVEIDVLNVEGNEVNVSGILNNNNIAILNLILNNVGNQNAVANGIVLILKDNGVQVCQVKVLELGVWNINIAKCNN